LSGFVSKSKKLKQELQGIRKSPKWAKANKTVAAQKRAKKKGARPGHAPQPRKELPNVGFIYFAI